MEEAFLEMEEITVTGEDPAISIMREVINRKKIWRENLSTELMHLAVNNLKQILP